MKKIIKLLFLVVFVAAVTLNVKFASEKNDSNQSTSFVTLENIEALAQGESPNPCHCACYYNSTNICFVDYQAGYGCLGMKVQCA